MGCVNSGFMYVGLISEISAPTTMGSAASTYPLALSVPVRAFLGAVEKGLVIFAATWLLVRVVDLAEERRRRRDRRLHLLGPTLESVKTRPAKALMMVQTSLSLIVLVVLIARIIRGI